MRKPLFPPGAARHSYTVVCMDTPDHDPEAALVARLLAKDEAAFELFYEEYAPPLQRQAERALDGDHDQAIEVLQETLCAAVTGLGAFRGEASLSGWLRGICHNQIAQRIKHRVRDRQHQVDRTALEWEQALRTARSDQPGSQLERRELAMAVHRTLDTLPASQARALELKYCEGLSVFEIAEALNATPKAVESLLSRARSTFRRRFS